MSNYVILTIPSFVEPEDECMHDYCEVFGPLATSVDAKNIKQEFDQYVDEEGKKKYRVYIKKVCQPARGPCTYLDDGLVRNAEQITPCDD
jgi:hypothetical protein